MYSLLKTLLIDSNFLYLFSHQINQQTLYKEQNHSATSGQKWAHLVIRKLWKIAWEIWQHRNNEAHKNDSAIQLEELIQQARRETEKGTQGILSLQVLMSSDETDRVFKGTSAYIQSWLRAVQARRNREAREQEQSTAIRQMQQTLRNFLTIQ